jgi:hypothetical protein
MKSQEFLSGINSSKTSGMSKSQMKTLLIAFFDIKSHCTRSDSQLNLLYENIKAVT